MRYNDFSTHIAEPPPQRVSGAEFQFPTEAGARYRLEGSADLQIWTVLLEDLAGTGGVLHVRDPEAAIFERYFYRVIKLP